MKKSELYYQIQTEIKSILSEESADDIKAKASAQAELNKELEKTAELTNEDEMSDGEMDKKASKGAKKGDSITTIANKLGETTSEMKRVVNKWKKMEDGPKKEKLKDRLKALSKIKKELEGLL